MAGYGMFGQGYGGGSLGFGGYGMGYGQPQGYGGFGGYGGMGGYGMQQPRGWMNPMMQAQQRQSQGLLGGQFQQPHQEGMPPPRSGGYPGGGGMQPQGAVNAGGSPMMQQPTQQQYTGLAQPTMQPTQQLPAQAQNGIATAGRVGSPFDATAMQQIAKNGTAQDKANWYLSMANQGFDDATIRAQVGNIVGQQSDADWNYLRNLATQHTNPPPEEKQYTGLATPDQKYWPTGVSGGGIGAQGAAQAGVSDPFANAPQNVNYSMPVNQQLPAYSSSPSQLAALQQFSSYFGKSNGGVDPMNAGTSGLPQSWMY